MGAPAGSTSGPVYATLAAMTVEERAAFERWEATLPEGEDDMTPEQRAEFAAIVAQYDAGALPMVAHDDVPAFLGQMARGRSAPA
jgi:hypothetical protein